MHVGGKSKYRPGRQPRLKGKRKRGLYGQRVKCPQDRESEVRGGRGKTLVIVGQEEAPFNINRKTLRPLVTGMEGSAKEDR